MEVVEEVAAKKIQFVMPVRVFAELNRERECVVRRLQIAVHVERRDPLRRADGVEAAGFDFAGNVCCYVSLDLKQALQGVAELQFC